MRAIPILALGLMVLLSAAAAQNIVENEAMPAREKRALTEAEVALLDAPLSFSSLGRLPERESRQLANSVKELIAEWPWMPFFHQLGISGSETHFTHPDELFHALSLALPCLQAEQSSQVKAFLLQRLKDAPPYAVEAPQPNAGKARERYSVPDALRLAKAPAARDAWGVYALYEFVAATGDESLVAEHWAAIRQRLAPLLEKEYPFDPGANAYPRDEAQHLNGDLAGLYAAIHLARAANDEASAKTARMRAATLMQLRLDLERSNPRLLEPTDSATKRLHHAKLARYLHLPEPMLVLLRHDGTGAERIRPFREARPGWWMAFGDRFIGGENYTTSPDFARALFIAATQLETVAPETSARWLDVPWCKADLFHIERLALFLRSAAGK